MQGSIKSYLDCIKQFSLPTLIAQGDDDQIVPIRVSALLSLKLVPGAILKIYPGAPHPLATNHPNEFNADLLAFIQYGERK